MKTSMPTLLIALGLMILTGCQSNSSTTETSAPTQSEPIKEKVESIASPYPVLAQKETWTAYGKDGRIYVVSEGMNEKFKKHGHLPYTKTLIGEGPRGETVVFEVDKKNPELHQSLMKAYGKTPILLDKAENYQVYGLHGRLYITSDARAESLEKHGHLPYTKTQIGAGPLGKTLVYEVNKKDPSVQNHLMETYANRPFLLEDGDDYNRFQKGERLYVTSDAMVEKFKKHGHLPYTKTFIGAGPQGETVIFEVNKKKPEVLSSLMSAHGPLNL